MAELKTQLNDMSVEAFLETVEDAQQREDCRALLKLMQSATHVKPNMWGTNIIGFGRHNYKYASGKEAIWFQVGFSPRKQSITLYLASGFDSNPDQMNKLGKHTTGKRCLYIKRLSEVDVTVVKSLITETVKVKRAE